MKKKKKSHKIPIGATFCKNCGIDALAILTGYLDAPKECIPSKKR